MMQFEELNEELRVIFSEQIDTVISLKIRPLIMGKIETIQKDVVFDLERVSYIDSGGINILMSSHRKLKDRGFKLRIVNVSESVMKIIRLGNLEKILQIEPA